MLIHSEQFRMRWHVIITYAQQASTHTLLSMSLFLVRAVVFTLNIVENRYFHHCEHGGAQE